jgi:hypothetical protein
VEGFEGGVFGLDGVDFGDWGRKERSGQQVFWSWFAGWRHRKWLCCWEEYVLEFALRSVAAEHSERPMYFVLPALRIASRAGMECSSGVSCWTC